MRIKQNDFYRLYLKAILYLNLFAIVSLASGADYSDDVEGLATQFRNARSATERRNICIAAIDRNIIFTGTRIVVLERIFGRKFDVDTEISKGFRRGVFFFKGGDITGEIISDPPGWYLMVEYFGGGIVHHYSLSNSNKPPFSPK